MYHVKFVPCQIPVSKTSEAGAEFTLQCRRESRVGHVSEYQVSALDTEVLVPLPAGSGRSEGEAVGALWLL